MKKYISIISISLIISNLYAQSIIKDQPQNERLNNSLPKTNNSTSTSTPAPAPIQKEEMPEKSTYDLEHSFVNKNKDFNARIINYQKGKTFIIYTALLIDTLIVLPENDNISFTRLNGGKFYSAKTVKKQNITTNKIFVNPKASGVTTTLTILTNNNNIYQFILKANNLQNNKPPDFIVYIKNPNIDIQQNFYDSSQTSQKNDNAPLEENYKYNNKIYTIKELKNGILPDPQNQINDYLAIIDRLEPEDFKKLNLIETEYNIVYNKKIDNPLLVFDDGRWTYFKFTETNSLTNIKIPTISIIENNIEIPTNPKILNNYIIIKTTGKKFILRRNKEYTCIFKRKIPELL